MINNAAIHYSGGAVAVAGVCRWVLLEIERHGNEVRIQMDVAVFVRPGCKVIQATIKLCPLTGAVRKVTGSSKMGGVVNNNAGVRKCDHVLSFLEQAAEHGGHVAPGGVVGGGVNAIVKPVGRGMFHGLSFRWGLVVGMPTDRNCALSWSSEVNTTGVGGLGESNRPSSVL